MKRKLTLLFFAIELNLLLWMILWGSGKVLGDSAKPGEWWGGQLVVSRFRVVLGFTIAAIVQHWAYYSVYRRAREFDSPEKASG